MYGSGETAACAGDESDTSVPAVEGGKAAEILSAAEAGRRDQQCLASSGPRILPRRPDAGDTATYPQTDKVIREGAAVCEYVMDLNGDEVVVKRVVAE